jgi:hypothetical protein
VQQLRARRGFGIAGAQPPRHRAGVAVEQMVARPPAASQRPSLVMPMGGYVELVAIDGPQNRGGRQQRDLMLAAAPAKKNAYAKFFCHFPPPILCRTLDRRLRPGICA